MLTHSHHKFWLLIAFLGLILALTITPSMGQFGAYAQTKSTVINADAAYTNSTTVTLTSSFNAVEMRFSNDNSEWSTWEAYSTTKSWTIAAIEGEKTVYAQFKDSASNVISANDKIILDLTIPDANVVSWTTNKDTVTFDASQCSDSNGIVSYVWNYGDGATNTGKISVHTYKEEGTYSGTLTIKDPAGNTGGTTFHIIIPYVGTSTTSPNPNEDSSGNPTPTGTPSTSPSPTPIPEVHGIDVPLTWLITLAIIIIITIIVILAVGLRKKSKELPQTQ